MRIRTQPIAAQRAAKEAIRATSPAYVQKQQTEAERITALRTQKAAANESARKEAQTRITDAREIARATGTQIDLGNKRGLFIGFDYKPPTTPPTIGGPFGVRELVCTKRDDGTYDRS